jgi:hypothetical protein
MWGKTPLREEYELASASNHWGTRSSGSVVKHGWKIHFGCTIWRWSSHLTCWCSGGAFERLLEVSFSSPWASSCRQGFRLTNSGQSWSLHQLSRMTECQNETIDDYGDDTTQHVLLKLGHFRKHHDKQTPLAKWDIVRHCPCQVEIVSHHSPLGSFYVPPEVDIALVPTNADKHPTASKSIQKLTYPISIGKTYFGF